MNQLKWLWWIAWASVAVGGNSNACGQEILLTDMGAVVAPHQLAVSDHCQCIQPQRIVIVAAKNREDRLDEQDLLANSLAKHLVTGPFSVVLSRKRVCASELPMRRGAFDEHELVKLGREYQADAVLYCELKKLVAYKPMQAEVSLLLVDLNQAVSLVSLHAVFDMQQQATQRSYALFSASAGYQNPLTDTHEHSPSMFIEFAAQQLAEQMRSPWGN